MSSTWTSHIYNTDPVLPRPGELIKIRYSVAALNFNFGPRSDGSLGSLQSSTTRRLKKSPFHHVVVSAVTASPTGSIGIQFFPIVSYSNPPPTYTGRDWDPVVWMQAQPDETTFRHLPIPANGWDTAPPGIWGIEPLDFGVWRNDKPAWMMITQRATSIPRTETWKRLSPPVYLSPSDLATLHTFEATVTVHFLSRNSVTTANYATVQDYDSVWAGIYAAASDGYDNSTDYASDSDDDDRGDGFDPVNIWRYDGAPKDMQEMVKRSDEAVMKMRKQVIGMWVAGIETSDCVEGSGNGKEEGQLEGDE